MRDRVKKKLDELESQGVIEKQEEPTDWVSALLITTKRSGDIRVCIDPRPLNKALKREHFELPTLDDMLPELGKQKCMIFSTLDCKNGFWHVRLSESSSLLTTFTTRWGRYRWKRMPFGVKPAPEIFQKRLLQVLQDLPGTFVVFDDILVVGSGENHQLAMADHNKKLSTLMETCQQQNIKLNPEKMKLRYKAVNFMGNVLTDGGLKPDPSKISAVTQMSSPVDKAGVQRVIGFVNYLSRFLPHLSTLLQPIRQLLRKNVQFQWSRSQQKAFDNIKAAVVQAPVLRYFNADEPVEIQCDASQSGLGAVLLQNGQPVCFASRSLTDCEKNYAQIEKELLSVLFSMKKFHTYVAGRKVIVYNDHKPLEFIVQKPLATAPRRLQRMLLALQYYDFKYVYTPGKNLHLADTLSRAPLSTSRDSDSVDTTEIEQIYLVQFLNMTDKTLTGVKTQSAMDPELCEIQPYVTVQCWPDKNTLPIHLKKFYDIKDELSYSDGCFFKGDRVVIPHSLQKEMAQKAHESHMALDSCLRRARDTMYWHGMKTDIEQVVSRCEPCMQYQARQSDEPMISHEPATQRWQKVAMDLCMLQGKTYLVTVDMFSSFIEIDTLSSDTSSLAVIKKLRAHFARHGIPETVYTDGGPQFSSSMFKEFSENYMFNHIVSSPHNHRSNGKAESAVKIVKNILKKCQEDKSDPYLALLTYHNTPQQQYNTSPAQRLFSRRTRTRLPTPAKLMAPQVVPAEDVTTAQEKRILRQAKSQRPAKSLDSLEKGDNVMLQPLRQGQKWTKAVVLEELRDRTYKIRTDSGSVLERNRRFLKKREAPTEGGNNIAQNDHVDQQNRNVDQPVQRHVTRTITIHDRNQTTQPEPQNPEINREPAINVVPQHAPTREDTPVRSQEPSAAETNTAKPTESIPLRRSKRNASKKQDPNFQYNKSGY